MRISQIFFSQIERLAQDKKLILPYVIIYRA